MMLFLRSLPALLALWLFACYTVALRVPDAFWVATGCAVILPIGGLRLLTRRAELPRRFGSLAFFPAVVTLGSFSVLLFSEHRTLQYIIAFAVVGLLYLFWEQAFRFTHLPARYQKNALTNLAILSAVVALLFFAITLFDLALFAGISLLIQVAIFIPFIVLWYGVLAYIMQISRPAYTLYGILLLVLGGETFVLLNRLPSLPTVKAGIFLVVIGGLVMVIRRHETPAEKQTWWPFGVLGLVLLCLVASARWFA